ncbi:hypothetical protein [Micromonospora sp. NPDC023814]|uniref:hypothetical protein n=1 Tax=Micromonospora sp. NPDC023814 TaxID=3154596 RepID=UPI0034013CFB
MDRTAGGSFAGRVAFVTGAANGIGRATALAFARRCNAVHFAPGARTAQYRRQPA